jgi:hypothetical protein
MKQSFVVFTIEDVPRPWDAYDLETDADDAFIHLLNEFKCTEYPNRNYHRWATNAYSDIGVCMWRFLGELDES